MPRTLPWANAGVEPSIDDLFSDPIARALMRADRISINEVRAVVTELRRRADFARRTQGLLPADAARFSHQIGG